MNQKQKGITTKIKQLLLELNFNEIAINNEIIYEFKDEYYKITYVSGLKAYVIEYACSFDEAVKNLYEDGDLYPLSLGSEKIIELLRKDIVNYYIDDSVT